MPELFRIGREDASFYLLEMVRFVLFPEKSGNEKSHERAANIALLVREIN